MSISNDNVFDLLEGGEKVNLFVDPNIAKVKEIRPFGLASDGNTVKIDYDNFGNFEGSSHKMASGEVDGKFYAWPTLFPAYDTGQDTQEWPELETWEAFDYASREDINELFKFDTEKEAQDFALGSWKP